MNSDDTLLKAQATRYFLDMVADHCQTPAELYEILASIPDPEQRYMVLDGVKPMLSFSTEGMVFEEPESGSVSAMDHPERLGDDNDDEEIEDGFPKDVIQ